MCWAAIDQLGDALSRSRAAGTRIVILASGLPGHWLQHAWLEDLCALTEVVEPGASLAAAMTVARGLVKKPPMALHALKRILRRAQELPLTESLAFEQDTIQQIAVTDDAINGMKSVQAAYDSTA